MRDEPPLNRRLSHAFVIADCGPDGCEPLCSAGIGGGLAMTITAGVGHLVGGIGA